MYCIGAWAGEMVPNQWGIVFKRWGVDGDGGEKPLPLPLPTGSGGIVGGVVGVGRERPLPLLLLVGLGGAVGGVVGVEGERPLPLPLHEERPPRCDSITVNAHTVPCGHCSSPLLFSSMLGVLAKIRGVLPALPLFPSLLFSKYATASNGALALPLENCSIFHVLLLEAILKSGME